MEKNPSYEVLNKNNSRPKSTSSFQNLPNLTNRFPKLSNNKKTSRDENKEDNFNFKVNLLPKKDKEYMYKNHMDLKQEIKDLNKKIDFLKSNNQKLSQIISQKNKDINDLTNQIILKNKELLTKEKKENFSKNNKIIKNGDKSKEKSENKKINKENVFEKDLQIKTFYNEISRIKEEYNKLIIEIRNKDEEILNLKRNKKITDYMEIKIKNGILTQEFNKLKEMYLLSLDMNKKNENFGKNENILKAEIQTQHDIIIQLNQEIDGFSLERKRMMTEIKELKNKLDLSLNNNKFIKNTKDKYEQKYRRNIKEQVIQKEYEKEKKEMLTKINKLQKQLDYYRMIAMKGKDFGANEKNMSNKIENKNIINNNLFNNRKDGIIVKAPPHPEENYDNKILLMQSIITELTNDKKELLEKLKLYEDKINHKNENIQIQDNNTIKSSNLLKTNEEILIGDNNENINLENKEKKNNSKIEDLKESQMVNSINESKEKEEENENIKKEDITFDDIFSLNLEYKNINSTNAKNIFDNIFTEINNENLNLETDKEIIINKLVNELSIKLNCNSKEEEKKEIYDKIKIYFEENENFENIFNMIFDSIINHNEESREIIDNENELILKNIFQKNKDAIQPIINNLDNKIRINQLYGILFKNDIKIKKEIFVYLCYNSKTEKCDSLYDIEKKELLKYI